MTLGEAVEPGCDVVGAAGMARPCASKPSASLRIFSRLWTRLQRSGTPFGPELSSGGCPSPDPAGATGGRASNGRAPASSKTVRSRNERRNPGLVPAADLPGMPESAILVPVPDAEPVVGRLLSRLDRSASRGIPPTSRCCTRSCRRGRSPPAESRWPPGGEVRARLRLPVRRHGPVRRGCPLAGSRACRAVPGAHRRRARGLPPYPPFSGAFPDVIPQPDRW
jgi:hypothetical protein